MNAAPSRGAGPAGAILSALLGVLALVACLAVVLLTDDDLDLAGVSPGGLPGTTGGDEDRAETEQPGAAGTGSGSDGSPSPDACTPAECPSTAVPTTEPGEFPFPPGATAPEWTDDFCADTRDEDAMRQVRMPVDRVRDWYFAHLADAGYQWGGGTGVVANPWRERDDGSRTPLGWGGSLTDQDGAYLGQLSMERESGGQTICGPPPGHVFITVTLP